MESGVYIPSKKKKKAWPEKRVIAVLKYLISPDPRKMSFKLDTH